MTYTMAAALAADTSMPEAGSSRSQTQAEKAEVFKRLHPDEYLGRFLAQGYRPDGRKVDGWRDVSVNIGAPRLGLAPLSR